MMDQSDVVLQYSGNVRRMNLEECTVSVADFEILKLDGRVGKGSNI